MYKARIKILVKAEGQRFVDAVNAEFAALLAEDSVPASAHHHPQARAGARGRALPPAARGCAAARLQPENLAATDAPVPAFTAGSNATCMAHKVPGYKRGDAVAQARRPAARRRHRRPDGRRAAALADRFSHGRSCASPTTRTCCCPGCSDQRLRALWHAAREGGFATPNIGLLTDMIACPGGDLCALANARSHPRSPPPSPSALTISTSCTTSATSTCTSAAASTPAATTTAATSASWAWTRTAASGTRSRWPARRQHAQRCRPSPGKVIGPSLRGRRSARRDGGCDRHLPAASAKQGERFIHTAQSNASGRCPFATPPTPCAAAPQRPDREATTTVAPSHEPSHELLRQRQPSLPARHPRHWTTPQTWCCPRPSCKSVSTPPWR